MSMPPVVNLTLPVYNEEAQLERHVEIIHEVVGKEFGDKCEIVIANNGSTDSTLDLARALARRLQGIRVIDIMKKGRGAALQESWRSSSCQVLSYVDIDLSTDMRHYPSLVDFVLRGQAAVAVGSRLLPGSIVKRGLKREIISRCYNGMLRAALKCPVWDAQCGFKAISHAAFVQISKHIVDHEWFFDTEMLILAQRCGLPIMELPVTWTDDSDSRVELISTIVKDCWGIVRLRRSMFSSERRSFPLGHHEQGRSSF